MTKNALTTLARNNGFTSVFLYNEAYKYSCKESFRWLFWLTECQQWLRDIHDIHIEICASANQDDKNIYESAIAYSWCAPEDEDDAWLPENTFDTYEDALMDAVIGAFKALEIKPKL
jgi:hypothetical protein